MSVGLLAALLLASALIGWHARDRVPLSPDFDATMTRRWARKLWRRRRRVS